MSSAQMLPLSAVFCVSLFPFLPLPLWSTSVQQILMGRSFFPFFPFFPSLPSHSRTTNALSPRQIGEAYAPQTCHIPTPLVETLEINLAYIGGQCYHPPGGQCTEANPRVVLRNTTTTRNLGAFSCLYVSMYLACHDLCPLGPRGRDDPTHRVRRSRMTAAAL